ncbi:LTA synthase family protein [Metabacillus arenae]|uniref:LTA synthase family protein n=1 Tax=Metabacillus arenae TaxID=2771434 RepID=A0A926NIK6_9BACI|nr:LTA synthase family protein [Metabacillus arenae]MBD1381420.1 LTA synthase family protein [Metabacillus arenae]
MLSHLLKKYSFLFLAVFLMWMKTYAVYLTGFDMKIENLLQAFILFLNPLSFFLLTFGFSLFMKERKRNIFIIFMSAIFTIVLIANMIFYDFYNDFLTIPVLFQSSNMGDLGSSILELVKPQYFLFFIDVAILAWFARQRKNIEMKVTLKEKKAYFLLVGILFMFNLGLAEAEKPQLLARSFDREMLVKNIGMFNFHIYDSIQQTQTTAQRALADSNRLTEIENYIKSNKTEPKEDKFGIAEGRNVIFVTLESTQSFVVDRKINGQEITPFLNDFIKESYYFKNFYHQTEQGKTSDSEFLVANSLYPLARGAVFFTHSNNKYYSTQEILKEKGYYSATFHANNSSFWNRDQMYKSFTVDEFIDVDRYDVNEENSIGWGLNDIEYFEQSVDMMKDLPQPFYSYFITLTNHFPFELEEEDRLIDEYTSKSKILNQYIQTVRYQDEALKRFIEKLKSEGLYENSIILFMGDHYGISENHNEAMAELLGKEEITPYENTQLQRVPFLIHMPGITDKNPEIFTQVSGQIDIKPTLLHLLGVNTDNIIHFGSDLFSDDHTPFTVLRNGNFITQEYISVSGICYERETGEVVEENEVCSKYDDKADKELTYSDRIIYGDLLRFYNKEKKQVIKDDESMRN